MCNSGLSLAFLLAILLSASQAYVKYVPCKEYIYKFRAKTTIHGSTNIVLKGKVGFQFLPNRTHLEALLRVHQARMQQGEEVDLLKTHNFGNWFSFKMNKDGEIKSVIFPRRESYDVIAVKKTLAGYLSGKLTTLDQPKRYKAVEEGPEGRHVADYERYTDSFDVIYVKKKRMNTHVAAEHAELKSSKTTYISHEMRVPHRIVMEENINGFSKPKPGYKMSRPPVGPGGNFTTDHISKRQENLFPGIKMDAKGEMELIKAELRNCKFDMPSGLRSDLLSISMEDKYKKTFWKDDYSKQTKEVHENLMSNLTCLRRSLNQNIPEQKDCFSNILSILDHIPDQHLPDIVYIHLELNEKHPSKINRQNRLLMLDAILSMRTELSQRLILKYILSPNQTISLEDHQRVLMQFGSFDTAPIQNVVNYIEKMAFSTKTKTDEEKDIQRMAVLIYGIMINLYHHKGTPAQKQRVHSMVTKLEQKVGIHDPYHWRLKRSATEPGVYHGEMEQVSLVESLGNAGLPRSYEHILSHVNSSETPYSLKRAALHALRNYHTEESAEVLLAAALYEEEAHIRSEALKIYQRHPLSVDFYGIHREIVEGYKNGSFPRCPKPIDDEEFAFMPHHHRIMRRSILKALWKGFRFRLKTPSVDWAKRFGNDKIGASLGLKIQNDLDINIKLTSGHVRLNIDDHAYALAHIGFLGFNFDILDAKVCLIGYAEYQLNLLQEFGFKEIAEFVKYWDRFQNGVVKNLKESVEKFRSFMSGVKDFAHTIENFDEILEGLPGKVKNLRTVAIQSARKIGAIDKKAIPSFAKPLIKVYRRVIKLFTDIKSDVQNFYNTLADIIRIEIPASWRYVREGVYTIGKSISKLFKSPKEAIQGMFKAIFKTMIGINGLKSAKKNIEDHFSSLKDNTPYWMDLTEQLNEIAEETRVALNMFQRGYTKWVKEGIDNFENEMREKAKQLILEIHGQLTAPFDGLKKLIAPFRGGFDVFRNIFDEIKQAWEQLKTAYREGRSIVDRLFGPKAAIDFPKKLRSSGAGCNADGAYPTTNEGRYHDSGVDLEAAAGVRVKSPYSGLLSVHSDGRLVIEPDGNTFQDIIVYVTNVQPDARIPRSPRKLQIYSGDNLGTVKNTDCVNHLHLSMTQEGQQIDPTRYLGQRKMIMPKWTQVCSEYKLVWLGRTIASGGILKRKSREDTSPSRSTTEPTNVDLPEPKVADAARRRRRKRDVSGVIDNVVSKVSNFTGKMKEFFDSPSDLGFSKFFEKFKIRKVRLGTIVGLLDKIGMANSKTSLINVIHAFINLTKVDKCVRPEEMTEEELRISLIQRGVKINASKDAMIDAYYEKSSQCPLWGLSLPKRSACAFDPYCLGVECCIDYRIGIFYKALKAFAVIDPCTHVLEMGVSFYPVKWKKSIRLRPEYGEMNEVFTPFKVDVFGKLFNLKIKYVVSSDGSTSLLSLHATLCESETDCLPYIVVVNDMLLPLPTCFPNETISWPKVNLKDFFSREHLIKELKKIKTNVAESVKERSLAYLEKRLKLPSGFLRVEQSVFCKRPSRMTRSQLRTALGTNTTTSSTVQLRQELKSVSTKCNAFTLPELPSALYCQISNNCFKLDCCLDVPLPILNKTVALSAFIHFDPCKFTLTYGFEHQNWTKLLIDYRWGVERSWTIGAMKIKYVLNKTEDSKFFILKFGIFVCPDESSCLIEKWILENHRVPMPLCNENFTKCFNTDYSFKSLGEAGVVAATKDAMKLVLRCLDVDKYLQTNHGCPTAATCSSDLTPALERTCYPGLPCWRIQCNFKLNLFVMEKNICAWAAFNPCSYELELRLGSWIYKDNLMKKKLGIMNEIRVGSVLRIYYKFADGASKTTFKMHFGVAVCYKDECTPTKYLMNGMEISKPFCDTNFTKNLPGGSIPKFLQWLGVNTTTTVARLAVDRALTYLGIRQCLDHQTCVLPTGVSLDGWQTTCPVITGLSALSKNLRCAFSPSCRKVSCCLDIDIKIWQGSLSFFYEFDPCNLRLRAGFENCTKEERLIDVGTPGNFTIHEKLKLWYLVKAHPEGKGLLLSFRVHVCHLVCQWVSILEDALFAINCNETVITRTKRSPIISQVENAIDYEVNSLMNNMEQMAEEKISKVLKKFDDMVAKGTEKVSQDYQQLQRKMQAVYRQEYGNDPQELSLDITKHEPAEDNIRSSAALIKLPSPSWNFEVIPPSGGAELFKITRDNGRLKFEIGEGLTQAGITLLGDAIANMTIGDLESMLDFKDIDPVRAHKLITQLRDLFFNMITELVDVVFSGKMNDALFKSFDYKMRGTMNLPRTHVKFFEYNYYFFVFPVPCLFSLGFGANGYWGVDISVSFEVLSMLAVGKLNPYIGMMAYGRGRADCIIFRGTLQLNGYIMNTILPTKIEIKFSKFPLDIGLCVDLVIHPLRLELVATVEMRVLFFMRRKRRFIRFIVRIFKAVVSFFRRIFKWIVLFRKVLWSWGLPPWRIPRLICRERKRPDGSPPTFPPPVSPAPGLSGCKVTQVPNRPIEEAAIVLEADPIDDVSKVEMFYSIGTTKGGVDLVNNMRFQGPMSIIETNFKSWGPLHVTVTARNSQGLSAQTFCELAVFDVTPTTGVITSSFYLTSDPTTIEMEAAVYEDSPIRQAYLGIGFGVGLTGDAVKPWHPVNLYRIPGPLDSRGYPHRLVINYRNLNLLHGELHFVNLLVRNALNHSAIISSKPVLVDMTPPTSNFIVNPTSDRTIKDNCQDYTLRKWHGFCATAGRRYPNHRIVVDSTSCGVLWNGHKANEPELRWTINNLFVAGRFTALQDNETKIRGYSMCVGTSIGSCDAFPVFDPHEAIRDPDEWNYIGFAMKEDNKLFPDGKYYLTLTAINKVSRGGPFATTVSRHVPFVIDTTPPEIDFVGNMRYDVETQRFSFFIRTKDIHSGLMKIALGAGKTRQDISIAPMTEIHTFPNTPNTIETYVGELQTSLDITYGEKIFIHLIVYNNIELETEFTSTRPFIIDTTPPIRGRVILGRQIGTDMQYFGHPEELCIAWSGFSDPESGIDSYNVAFGRCEGCNDLFSAENVKPTEHFYCLPSSHASLLRHNQHYYAVVSARNGGSEGLRVSVNSSKMVFDQTPPIAGTTVDGSLPDFVQQNFASDRSFYRLQWRPSTDPESSVSGYNVSVYKRSHSSGTTEKLRSNIPLKSSDNRYSVSGLDLQHQDRLHAELVSINGAGLQTLRVTSGVTWDFTPPRVVLLHDGDSETETQKFQSAVNALSVTYITSDGESDISMWKFSVFKVANGQRHLTGIERTVKKNDAMNTTRAMRYTVSPLTLISGHRYGIELTVVNRAGLHTIQDSPGVVVDDTSPNIESVTIGSLINQDAETHDGYVWHQNQDTLTITVLAFDPESKVRSLWISVGTSAGASDVAPVKEYNFKDGQFISLRDIHLNLSNLDASPRPTPSYYVTVQAENFAGLNSSSKTSLPILVVPDDSAGEVFAGPTADQVTEQVDSGRIVATFRDFRSPLHGIERYEVAIGSQPGLDDVQSFTEDGVGNLNDEMTSGQIHLPIDLEVGRKYFVTIRAFTNAGRVLESVSAPLTISQSKPLLKVDLPKPGNTNGIFYSDTNDAVPVEITSPDSIWMVQIKSSAPKVIEGLPEVSNVTGAPVYTIAHVENALGFQTENTSVAVVADVSPPTVGSIECDTVIQYPSRSLTCNVSGLQDVESPIVQTRISVQMSTTVTRNSSIAIIQHPGPLSSHTFFLTANDLLLIGVSFIVIVDVTNTADLTTSKLSATIYRDPKHPSLGKVIDLGDVITLQYGKNYSEPPEKRKDQTCQVSRNSVSVGWSSSSSPQSQIIKHDVAIGSYNGASDMKSWVTVGHTASDLTLNNVDIWKVNKTFATVRATSASSLTSVAYSNGISISNLAVGAYTSKMGIFDGKGKNSRYQTDPRIFQSRWDFSKEPCPILLYEWAIRRADGFIIRNFTNMEGLSEGVHFGLNAKDGDTFFSYIRVTNALHFSYIFRSPGLTIKMQPLLPGLVFDGLITDHDLLVQQSIVSLSANWKNFRAPHSDISFSGNIDQNWKPKIESYEIAFGTDPTRFLDNIVPFTNVGLNTSASFFKLQLKLGTTYYATVRANSRGFAQTQATSNGIHVGMNTSIEAGPITCPEFVKAADALKVHWRPFTSNIKVKMYFVGIRKTKAESPPSCSSLVLAGEDSAFLRGFYDTYPRTLVNDSSQFLFTELPFEHNTNYTVDVIGINGGGECARSQSSFLVDFTPPETGPVTLTNKRTYKNVYFVRKRSSLKIQWAGFNDPESKISTFSISLLQSTPTCHSETKQPARLRNGEPAVFTVNSLVNEFVMQDLNLQIGVAYFVKVEAVNKAGGISHSLSNAVIVEDLTATKGVVKTTDDFTQMSAFYFSILDTNMNISFLHTYATGHLELATIPITPGAWTAVTDPGMSNIHGYPWILLHTRDMTRFTPDGISLTMRRLIGQRGIQAGGVSRVTTFQAGGSFSFRMQAAPGPYAVSSFVVWDGVVGEAADFHPSRHTELRAFCGCCMDKLRETCPCDCSQYLKSLLDLESTTTVKPEPKEPEASVWEVSPAKGEPVKPNKPTKKEVVSRNACGLQIIPTSSTSQNATLWCFNKATRLSVHDTVPLIVDVSAREYDYKIDYIHTVIDTWSIRLVINGEEIVIIEGALPVFPDKVTALFHVWNNWKSLAPVENLEKPYQVTMTVSNVKFPNKETKLLRYGHPFRLSGSYPVEYDVRIALVDSNSTDDVTYITNWKKIAAPCVPCGSSCSALYCDPKSKCPHENLNSIKATIENVGFTNWIDESDGNITRFQAHLRMRTYGGYEVNSVSTPATMDSTPCQQLEGAPIAYFDVDSKEPYKAVRYQASNTTLRVMASFVDPESGVAQIYWAAGTAPGVLNLFGYSLVTGTGFLKRTDLSLKDNTSYYSSFLVINNAGMIAEYVDASGVKVLSSEPDVSKMKVEVPGTKDFDAGVKAKNTKATKNSDKISASWSVPPQEYETKTEFCIGSRPGVADDIVDCMKISHRKTGSANITFKDGELQVSNVTNVNMTDVLYRGNHKPPEKGIHLEPGKCLHYHVRACNAADKCKEKPLDSVQVVDSSSKVITPDGTSVYSLDDRVRRKRSVGTFQVNLKTLAGENDVSLIFGKVNDSQKYRADTVVNYNSYIVNAEATKNSVTRMLQKRISSILQPTFYVTSVGQVEMKSAFQLIVDLQGIPIKNGTSPQIIYWNTETKLWTLAYYTCIGESKPSLKGKITTVMVCRTQSGAANYTTSPSSVQHFFRYETQFAVALVRDEIHNQAPVINPVPPLYITGTEEAYIARLKLRATDADNDPITWSVVPPLPTLGDINVESTTGLLTYKSFIGVIGTDLLRIKATDNPPYKDIPPKSTVIEITANLTTKVNSPYLVISVDNVPQKIVSYDIKNQALLSVIGLNEKTKTCLKPTVVDVYVLHIDNYDNVSIIMTVLSNSSMDFWLSKITAADPVFDDKRSGVPNSLKMYNWYHTRLFYGLMTEKDNSIQRLQLIAQDPNDQLSKPLVLEISMMEDFKCSTVSTGGSGNLAVIIGITATVLVMAVIAVFSVFTLLRRGKKILPQPSGHKPLSNNGRHSARSSASFIMFDFLRRRSSVVTPDLMGRRPSSASTATTDLTGRRPSSASTATTDLMGRRPSSAPTATTDLMGRGPSTSTATTDVMDGFQSRATPDFTIEMHPNATSSFVDRRQSIPENLLTHQPVPSPDFTNRRQSIPVAWDSPTHIFQGSFPQLSSLNESTQQLLRESDENFILEEEDLVAEEVC